MLFLVKSVDPVENMVSVDDNLLTRLAFHLHDFAETSAIDNIIKNNIFIMQIIPEIVTLLETFR